MAVKEILYILIVMVVTQFYMFVKQHYYILYKIILLYIKFILFVLYILIFKRNIKKELKCQ